MIKNYKMVLQYDGTKYNGWQKQGNTENTIQGKLEAIISKYLNQPVEVNGSGRTDAGVHALGQTANFKFDDKDMDNCSPKKVLAELNHYLPEDVKILTMEEVDPRFHARLNAKKKVYRYCISLDQKRDVFERKFLAQSEENSSLDVRKMRDAAKLFLGEHDFEGFSDNKAKKKSTVRTVEDITLAVEEKMSGHILAVEFTGNGFLYHMVRLMMGTLLEIGYGRCDSALITEILDSKNRKQVPQMAPAEGLFLKEVFY